DAVRLEGLVGLVRHAVGLVVAVSLKQLRLEAVHLGGYRVLEPSLGALLRRGRWLERVGDAENRHDGGDDPEPPLHSRRLALRAAPGMTVKGFSIRFAATAPPEYILSRCGDKRQRGGTRSEA